MKTKGKKKVLIYLVTLSLIFQLMGGIAMANPESDEGVTLQNMTIPEDSNAGTQDSNNAGALDNNSSNTLENIDIDALENSGGLGGSGSLEGSGNPEAPGKLGVPGSLDDPDSLEALDEMEDSGGLETLDNLTPLNSPTSLDGLEDPDSAGFLGTSIELRDGEIDITGNTAEAIQTAIQTAIDEGATGFKVVGTKKDQAATITLNIPAYVTVKWGAETKDLSLAIDGGGTFEVVAGGSIDITGDDMIAIHSGSCKVSVTGGTVVAKGEMTIAIHTDSGDVTVTAGTVSAPGDMFDHYPSAIETYRGNVLVTGGTVYASGRDCYVISQGFIFDSTSGGTVTIAGGLVKAETSSFSNYYAISLQNGGLAVFVTGTCVGELEVWGAGMIVEIATFDVPTSYSGTNNGITWKEGASLANIAWDLSGAVPALKYKTFTVYKPQGGPVVPPTPESHPVKLRETGDLYETVNAAMEAAEAPAGANLSTYTLEITGDVTELAEIIIKKNVTLLATGGSFTLTLPSNRHIKVESGGALTLGDSTAVYGDGTPIYTLTIAPYIEVTNGSILVQEGVRIHDLKLNGPNVTGEITGGRLEGITALDVKGGAKVTEISGGIFSATQDAVHVSDRGTIIELISGGSFYQTKRDQSLHGHAIFVQNEGKIGRITGGYFEAERGAALYVIRGSWVDEISGGTFKALREGLSQNTNDFDHWNYCVRVDNGFTSQGYTQTGIGTISGGTFGDPVNESAHFGLILITDNITPKAKVTSITGGTFYGIVALQVDRGGWIGTISGGTFSGSQGMLNVGQIDRITGDATSFSGSSSYGIINWYSSSTTYGSIGEIESGTFTGSTTGFYNAARIETISDGSFIGTGDAAMGLYNSTTASITLISGGNFIGKVTGNGFNNLGTITEISGGTFIGAENRGPYIVPATSGSGIRNTGTITLISGGRFIGENYAINNYYPGSPPLEGSIGTIQNGVFWGKTQEAIFLTKPLILEPGLSASKGLGRYWGKDGVIFNDDALVTYPPYGTGGEKYFMSTKTEAVTGITGAQFKFLTFGYEVIVIGSQAAVTGAGYYLPGERVDIDAGTWRGTTFDYWETDDGVVFNQATSPATHFTMPNHNVTVTANWKTLPDYKLVKVIGSYATDSGSGGYRQGDSVTIDAGDRSGYTFAGWQVLSNNVELSNALDQVQSFTMPDSNVEIIALWTRLPSYYTVTVVDSFSEDSGFGTYLEGAEVTVRAGVRGGYSFTGWTVGDTVVPDGRIVLYDSIVLDDPSSPETTFVMPSFNVTLIAHWAADEPPPPPTYTVTYAPGLHGTFTTVSHTGLLAGTATPAAPSTPGEAGWRFTGWLPARSATVTGNVTYVAQWEAIPVDPPVDPPAPTYTVTYAPGLHGTFTAVSFSGLLAGAATPAAPGTPAEDGWRFTGWLPARSATVSGNVTYVAQWEEIPVDPPPTYTVSFQPGLHGTFAAVSHTGLAAGSATPAAPATPGEAGWRFTGWLPAVSATVTGNATYVAQWTRTDFTVTFVDHDGAVLKTEQVAPGASATAPPNPTREGYTFTGWDRSFTNVQADITVKALYASVARPANPNEYTPDEVLKILEEEGVPIVSIGGREIPLYGKDGLPVWALVNLVLAVCGVLLALVTVLQRNPGKKREKKGSVEAYGVEGVGGMSGTGGVGGMSGMGGLGGVGSMGGMRSFDEADEKRRQHRFIAVLLTVVFALAGIVFFFVTENMKNLMVLIDYWTIANAVIFVAIIVCMVLALRKKDRMEESARR